MIVDIEDVVDPTLCDIDPRPDPLEMSDRIRGDFRLRVELVDVYFVVNGIVIVRPPIGCPRIGKVGRV